MSESPREQLGDLCAGLSGKARADLARRAGITSRQATNAFQRRPVATVAFLRLCIALNFNPAPEIPLTIPTPPPSDFDHAYLALAFRIMRGINKQSVREAGKIIGVSGFTISRLENGHIMSIGVVLRACGYIGVHPFGYLREIVSREKFASNSMKTHRNAGANP